MFDRLCAVQIGELRSVRLMELVQKQWLHLAECNGVDARRNRS
jgi:hypothetical protein